MGPRTELRDRFEAGLVDKHELARAMRDHHRALEDYATLLADGEVSSVTIEPGEVIVESALEGIRFVTDFGDAGAPPVVLLATGSYEPQEMRVLRILLAGARAFVDVGANVGWYALHAKALHPELQVIALEPVARTHATLRRNAELNGLDVVIINQGLADAPGEIEIFMSPAHSGAASAAPSREYEGTAPERCAMTTLDRLASERGLRVDVLKADVEGGELTVVRGGLRTIERDRPAIMLELLRLHAEPFGYHPNEVIDLLDGLGYECYASTEAGVRPFGRMDDETVETNFFFLHPQRHAAAAAAITS